MNQSTIATKVTTFATDHPNAVVCAMYRRSWRNTDKLTHIYYTVKDGQPARIPAHKTIDAHLPRYTLDIERGCAWRDYTGHDVFARWLAFTHRNEAYLNDREFERLQDCCRGAALRLNRWLKNGRIGQMRREGRLA